MTSLDQIRKSLLYGVLALLLVAGALYQIRAQLTLAPAPDPAPEGDPTS